MDVRRWLSALRACAPFVHDPGVACSLRSHSPLATFWPRLSALPVPAQRAPPFWPRLRRFLLAAPVGAPSIYLQRYFLARLGASHAICVTGLTA
jgi:hypothetical protein